MGDAYVSGGRTVSIPLHALTARPDNVTHDCLSTNDKQRFMIVSFAHREAEALFKGYRVRRFVRIESVIRRKLAQLHSATSLGFLRAPPGNRLEALQGDRFGQYSIWVNDQYRICFRWSGEGARGVEIVDYH